MSRSTLQPPTNDIPTTEDDKTNNSGSAFDVLLFVKRHFLDGKPIFYNIVEHYGKVRPTYFFVYRTKRAEFKFGNIIPRLIFYSCNILDMFVSLLHAFYMFAVLLVLLYGLFKVVGLDQLLLKFLHV
jgi:hypothetical protein